MPAKEGVSPGLVTCAVGLDVLRIKFCSATCLYDGVMSPSNHERPSLPFPVEGANVLRGLVPLAELRRRIGLE